MSDTDTTIVDDTTPPSTSPPSPPATPKRKRKSKAAASNNEAGSSSDSTGSPSTPSPRKRIERLTPAVKKSILALKMGGMATKDIAASLGQNYKTVWGFIDKTTKSAGSSTDFNAEMSEADKKEAALALKLAGMKTRDIAEKLGMNYKTLWGYFDKIEKGAGLPEANQQTEL